MKAKTKNKKITIDDLAGMTKRGFDELGKIIGDGFSGIQKGMEQKFEALNKNISILSENNAREHETIFLCLGNVAHKFELDDLEKRVEVLEKKVINKK